MTLKSNILALSASLVLSGCVMGPLKPGWASFSTPTGVSGVVQQSENPAQESTQVYERITEPCNQKVTERVTTVVGAAQKDDGRNLAAKLKSLRGITFLGAAVFLFGVASAFWLPLKAVVGSLTTSLMIAAAGLVLIVLPSFVVGNELLIMGLALGIAAIVWFMHRHGELRGRVKQLEK